LINKIKLSRGATLSIESGNRPVILSIGENDKIDIQNGKLCQADENTTTTTTLFCSTNNAKAENLVILGWGGGWGMMGPWGWGGGIGMMGPWGWGGGFGGFGYPSVTYSAGKVAILNFDASANIQSVKTIDKQQSDINVDQFIGYGIINNAAGTNFLYYQKSKGAKQLVHQQLSASGAIIKGNPIMINEKQVEWMPRSLKQVGEKEAILPYQSKGKLGFAKITIQ
jgi:hypothetical protein